MPSGSPNQSTLARLRATHDPAEVEQLVDELTNDVASADWTSSLRAQLIEALILQLAVDSVRDDPDAEDAVCSALTRFGVMTRRGNLVFEFRPITELATADSAAVARSADWLPKRYAPTRADSRGTESCPLATEPTRR